MITNLLYCLLLRQLRTYGMLNKIVDPSNDLCIVCFQCIYQNKNPLLNIFHRQSLRNLDSVFLRKTTDRAIGCCVSNSALKKRKEKKRKDKTTCRNLYVREDLETSSEDLETSSEDSLHLGA